MYLLRLADRQLALRAQEVAARIGPSEGEYNPDLSAIEEIGAEFLDGGGPVCDFGCLRNEALFGLSVLGEEIRRNDTCLEVGSGPGLLAYMLARRGIKVDALDPVANGFETFEPVRQLVEKKKPECLTFLRMGIEELQASGSYDFIYSINVFEHLLDWRAGLLCVYSALKPGGVAHILCPNYDVPVESHFKVPILYSKEWTRRIFAKWIRTYEQRERCPGLWDSVNLIQASEVYQFCYTNGMQIEFDRRIVPLMMRRLGSDEEFTMRWRSVARFLGRMGSNRGVQRLLSNLPISMQPYVWMKISKSNLLPFPAR